MTEERRRRNNIAIMSDENNNEVDTSCCASCGTEEVDGIKLVPCDGCDLVRYCDEACQELHRPEHAGKCRKRAAELGDERLFKQPESSCYGDCPICCLPLPLDPQKCTLMSCCSKYICTGCMCANLQREMEMRLQHAHSVVNLCTKQMKKVINYG